MTTCPLCGCSESERILDKPAIPIFTNADDTFQKDHELHPCELQQCTRCSHVFQKITERLKNTLDNLYRSSHAQITTPLGSGNWGKERAPYLMEKLKRIETYKGNISILELGCGNGYILRALNKMGFSDLSGIEPSLERTEEVDGVLLVKDFVREDLELGKEFDIIFSFGVYEHIEDVKSFTSFSLRHLRPDGELFIYMPNCEKSLDSGDPGMFTHQHVHYFVKRSLINYLRHHGLVVKEDVSDAHALAMFAGRSDKVEDHYEFKGYAGYQDLVDGRLHNVGNVLKSKNLIIHGACNSLNNILGWDGRDYDFTLVDNDMTKWRRTFFGKHVHSISDINLAEYDTVLIVPINFADDIMKSYRSAGFEGKFRVA